MLILDTLNKTTIWGGTRLQKFGSDPLEPHVGSLYTVAGNGELSCMVLNGEYIGLTLYEKLLGGACADFRTGYLEAPAALFTRAVLQPRLDVRTGQCGTTVPKSAYAQPAGDTARRHLRRALLAQARTLLHRAAEHLRAHRDEFPEYDPENDIFNRCTTDGGFVQIR